MMAGDHSSRASLSAAGRKTPTDGKDGPCLSVEPRTVDLSTCTCLFNPKGVCDFGATDNHMVDFSEITHHVSD